MAIDFFTRLPLHGETHLLPTGPINRVDWFRSPPRHGGANDKRGKSDFGHIDYLAQIAKAAELSGFGGVLLVNAPTGEEPWTISSLLARETQQLRFVTAFHPAHLSPWTAVQISATYQRATGNRLIWNIINGGSEVVARQFGDFTPHDQRYERAIEWLDVVKGYWNEGSFTHEGKYYRAGGGGRRGSQLDAELPLICTAGSSEAARELGAKHADYYLMRAERPQEIAALIGDVSARARKYGRPTPRFGLSIDVITRATEAEALAEARRFFDAGIARGAAKARAAQASTRSARKLGYEHDYVDQPEAARFEDFFIHPNVWSGLGFIGVPPGCALVGSYENVVARICEYHAVGIDLFFLAGHPHLEEAYRIGEHILPHFAAERAPAGRPQAHPNRSLL